MVVSEGMDEFAHRLQLAEFDRLTRPSDSLKQTMCAKQEIESELLHIRSALEHSAQHQIGPDLGNSWVY